METYFSGSRSVKKFKLEGKKKDMYCEVFESWQDLATSQTSRCGISSTLEIQDTSGIEEETLNRIESEMVSSLGIPKVAEIRSSIKALSENRITLSKQKTLKRTYTVPSHRCGTTVHKFFQMVRIVHVLYQQPRLFSPVKETKSVFTESTNQIDFQIYSDEFDESCGCREDEKKASDGLMRFFIGRLSVLTPFYSTKNGFVTDMGNLEFEVSPLLLTNQAILQVSMDALPDVVQDLSRIEADIAEVRMELQSLAGLKNVGAIHILSTTNPEFFPLVQKNSETDSDPA